MFNRDGWIEKKIRPHFDVQMRIAGGEKQHFNQKESFHHYHHHLIMFKYD